ncbi:DNA-binding Xre family transcriptional regulator [Anaerosolibacter carboniphilus]|uniref:DNA-binding Xre family transcriptional regulator n=1 Tax=Anaerosolibacter carboniphilus TaxID=1417629 RepID=A0A841KQL2_9FIRM|nr:DUF739 family protein [Anaerosolibacter carboniphilus]MBB6215631.1 DNA-binding Xre family transcriptional regulator [Anaerosolibacter carboniphilus]
MKKTQKRKRFVELQALKGLIREKKSSYRKLSVSIGIATNTLSDKINGFYCFGADEIDKIVDELEIEVSDIGKYFFPQKCSNYTKKNIQQSVCREVKEAR